MKVFKMGERVMVEGVIESYDKNGYNIQIKDGELTPIGTFYFSSVSNIRTCPPTCPECGMDMEKTEGTYRCQNCGSLSGNS